MDGKISHPHYADGEPGSISTTPHWPPRQPAPRAAPLAVPSNRYRSIDAFRVIANVAIVWVHTCPFITPDFGPQVRFFGELLNQSVRGAVPFFFLASGYFFSSSVSRGTPALNVGVKIVRRLALFAIFWSSIYILLPIGKLLQPPYPDYATAVLGMIHDSLRPSVVLTGTFVHLWFLSALICAIVLLTIASTYRLEKYFAVLVAALFLIGLAGSAYKPSPFGIPIAIHNTRDGPFYSSLFVFTGYFLHKYGMLLSLRTAYILILCGIALRVTELYWLMTCCDVRADKVDFLLGSYPFGVGVFVWLLNSPRLGENRWLVRLSRYSPGVYCAHMLFLSLLSATPLFLGSPLWELTRPFLILGLTFAWVAILARVPLLRPVIT